MNKTVNKMIVSLLFIALLLSGCGSKGQENMAEQEKEKAALNIAFQYGLAYAPLIIAQEQNLIENVYKESTGKEVDITWTQMSSGADISTGIASGSIDVGFLGIGPAITGTLKNVGFKVFTNLSGQEHGLMTNDESIKSLEDIIDSDRQIALVNTGSIQHIILAKALVEAGYDAHALDSNIVAMKHPDGMTALETGSVKCHLTSSPYIYLERGQKSLYEIASVSEAWPKEKSFIVGVAAEKLYGEDEELYNAVCQGIEKAIDFINENTEEAAKITCEFNGNSIEEELEYLRKGNYSTETSGLFELSQFMYENGFVEKAAENYYDLAFENVKGN